VSYILDALDKAEQDRQHTRAPNLKTTHSAVIEPDRFRTPLWITLLALVALALALILYQSRDLLWPQQGGQILGNTSARTIAPSDTASFEQQGDPDKGSFVPADLEVPVRPPPVPALVRPQVVGEVEHPSEQQPMIAVTNEVLNINDLPLSVQRQIPDLTFSTHIYASDAAWRAVGINGRSRREGDMIQDNLVLQEITEQGVVLGFEGYSFTMSVLKNWSSE